MRGHPVTIDGIFGPKAGAAMVSAIPPNGPAVRRTSRWACRAMM
jgi:hypothetical protein